MSFSQRFVDVLLATVRRCPSRNGSSMSLRGLLARMGAILGIFRRASLAPRGGSSPWPPRPLLTITARAALQML